MCARAYGTVYSCGMEMDLYQSSLPAVFAAIPVLYTIAESPLQRLHVRRLECLFKSLLESFLERASHLEESSFPEDAFGRWKTLSLWKLWLIGTKSVDVLTLTLT